MKRYERVRGWRGLWLSAAFLLLLPVCDAFGQIRLPVDKKLPPKSSFYLLPSALQSSGIGNISKFGCSVGVTTQPSIYADNMLLDCDGEIPHNETTMAVNPGDSNHAVGGYHSYQLQFNGATAIAHIVSTASVTLDGGQTWNEVLPPIGPYQFTGDPALTFDGDGRVYLASIADHEGPGGPYSAPSVVVARSDSGGLTWSRPVTVAKGFGAVTPGRLAPLVFQDKEFIVADPYLQSPQQNRVYVTWTSFQESPRGPSVFSRSPISLSFSDDGVHWTPPAEISGTSTDCAAHLPGGAGCDLNQFSSPSVAPTGTVYVGFENFNTVAENQYLVVSSTDGGYTWSSPSRVGTVHDINFPQNVSGRDTLTGCQFRVAAAANIAADPSDPTGRRLYAVWADNRNGDEDDSNADVFLSRSTDGGLTWVEHVVDSAANDQFYPWVSVASSGRVDVGYMDRAYSSGQDVCQYGFTLARVTFDGSGNIATLSRQRVDTGLSDPGQSRWFSGATNGNSLFLGDYNAVAVAPDGSTYSLWTDHRNEIPGAPAPRNHGQHAVGTRTP
jgi:hypothetical protein